MASLITRARATELVPNFPSADGSIMDDIVSSTSGLIEKWCGRTFALSMYDEVYDGTNFVNLFLNQFPVSAVYRVMYIPVQVLMIRNTDSTVSWATFRLDSTTLYLRSMRSGVETDHNLTLASYATLGALATAISAFSADGWNATALGIYSTWATSDLFSPQAGSECRWYGSAYLWHHTASLPSYQVNYDIGEIVTPYGFSGGYHNYRVQYQAGFATVPYDVQQACAELSAAVYLARNSDSNLSSESLGAYSYSRIAEQKFEAVGIASKYLQQYRNYRVPKFRVLGA